MAERDYYEVLGVRRTATSDEIRAAHRKLAMKYHPDRNKGSADAEKRFAEVQQAFEVLGDPDKRRRYDQFGHAGQQVPPPGYPGDFGGTYGWEEGGVRVEDFDSSDPRGGTGGMFEDLFEQLYSDKGPFGRQRRQRARRGEEPGGGSERDVEYPITLTFAQAARGTTLPITIQRPGGRTEGIEVKIPAGVKTGSRIRIRGRGQPAARGMPAGDLFIVVNVREHPFFRRDNLDILLDLPVSIYEALLGSRVTVPTLDGDVTINIPAGTSSGAKLRIREHGVHRGSEKGDQYCVVKVVVPKQMDDADRELVEQLQRRKPVDARADQKW